ncbi:DUF2637 domain-containing protein [Sphaerisporangium fuscum]|uniref:DUF2637 domain-containing protein n=1 Tax=Sphaerisporangium fuscum TaxID=2835868 RepID=UPI001BDCD3FF|nr:DUF2637 domain-containing protein [Sphaerisporangium fuscum]
MNPLRRLGTWLLDSGPVVLVALIAGAGSFTHIRDTATEHGQSGPMAWAIAVCVDLTCVMAARERQRDKRRDRQARGLISWPTLVMTGGILLSLAANLAQADPSPWGWITAATPAVAFLVAVSLLERRAALRVPVPTADVSPPPSPSVVAVQATEVGQEHETPLTPTVALSTASTTPAPQKPGTSGALLTHARKIADDYQNRYGKPITRDLLRAQLGVSNQLASDLLRDLTPA